MVGSPEQARLTAVPAQSFFLFGVRGTGKSTWSQKALISGETSATLSNG